MSGSGGQNQYLITTTVAGRSWHWEWEYGHPISVDHHSDWELQAPEGGAVKFVHRTDQVEIEVNERHFSGQEDLHLPAYSPGERDLNVRFRRLYPLRAAYLPDLSTAKRMISSAHFVSAGVR
ncbi:hypothetical protein EB061_01670, partial [bacterium]|nr:hypothetical protein [bacterium]